MARLKARATRAATSADDSKAQRVLDEQRTMGHAVDSEEEDDGSGFSYRLRHAILTRQVHEHRTITYAELARESGLNEQSVSRYASGAKMPIPRVGARIARRLRCTAGWLYFGGRYGRPGSQELMDVPAETPREAPSARVAGVRRSRSSSSAR